MIESDTVHDKRLKVAIAMLTLVPGTMGGGETYARGLVRSIPSRPRIDATAYVGRQAKGFATAIPEVVCEEIDGQGSTSGKIVTLLRGLLNRGRLRRTMQEADVFHFPFAVALPQPEADKAVVQTVFDMQHYDLPHLFSRAERVYRRLFYERTSRSADAIITISDFAKQTIVDHLGIPAEKIFTAYLAVDSSDFTPNLGPREDFILYPARGWAHKNHATLFDAMRLLEKSHPGLKLVLTGGGLESLENIPGNVEVRGQVPLAELRELYQTASCLVFPSLYEGFGFPPLEAMASGCPVACSTSGSLPEVVGDAAVLFDPHSPEAIAQAVLDARSRADELRALGFEQVKKFTWDACAKSHENAYAYAASARDRRLASSHS
ncbi:glycosyltransferase family 4 protein [Sinomonas sp. P47F7]|uniref:glycosyltransferase family 4 protein n=1 Tax=Sinomonas sp. P47F7 TaxID=3410987 RepID=UPI003BF5FDDB